MKWHQCKYIDGTPNNQYISDTMQFKSGDIILNPYISTNNNIYYLFKYDQTGSMLLPVEYIYEVFVNHHKIDLSKNNYTVGDVTYFPDSESYNIYTNEGWDMICARPIKYKEMLPKICKCCGAPLKGWKCEYCEVEYD